MISGVTEFTNNSSSIKPIAYETFVSENEVLNLCSNVSEILTMTNCGNCKNKNTEMLCQKCTISETIDINPIFLQTLECKEPDILLDQGLDLPVYRDFDLYNEIQYNENLWDSKQNATIDFNVLQEERYSSLDVSKEANRSDFLNLSEVIEDLVISRNLENSHSVQLKSDVYQIGDSKHTQNEYVNEKRFMTKNDLKSVIELKLADNNYSGGCFKHQNSMERLCKQVSVQDHETSQHHAHQSIPKLKIDTFTVDPLLEGQSNHGKYLRAFVDTSNDISSSSSHLSTTDIQDLNMNHITKRASNEGNIKYNQLSNQLIKNPYYQERKKSDENSSNQHNVSKTHLNRSNPSEIAKNNLTTEYLQSSSTIDETIVNLHTNLDVSESKIRTPSNDSNKFPNTMSGSIRSELSSAVDEPNIKTNCMKYQENINSTTPFVQTTQTVNQTSPSNNDIKCQSNIISNKYSKKIFTNKKKTNSNVEALKSFKNLQGPKDDKNALQNLTPSCFEGTTENILKKIPKQKTVNSDTNISTETNEDQKSPRHIFLSRMNEFCRLKVRKINQKNKHIDFTQEMYLFPNEDKNRLDIKADLVSEEYRENLQKNQNFLTLNCNTNENYLHESHINLLDGNRQTFFNSEESDQNILSVNNQALANPLNNGPIKGQSVSSDCILYEYNIENRMKYDRSNELPNISNTTFFTECKPSTDIYLNLGNPISKCSVKIQDQITNSSLASTTELNAADNRFDFIFDKPQKNEPKNIQNCLFQIIDSKSFKKSKISCDTSRTQKNCNEISDSLLEGDHEIIDSGLEINNCTSYGTKIHPNKAHVEDPDLVKENNRKISDSIDTLSKPFDHIKTNIFSKFKLINKNISSKFNSEALIASRPSQYDLKYSNSKENSGKCNQNMIVFLEKRDIQLKCGECIDSQKCASFGLNHYIPLSKMLDFEGISQLSQIDQLTGQPYVSSESEKSHHPITLEAKIKNHKSKKYDDMLHQNQSKTPSESTNGKFLSDQANNQSKKCSKVVNLVGFYENRKKNP